MHLAKLTCQGKEGKVHYYAVSFVWWTVTMPTACKSIKMRDIQHYLQNFESLSQTLVRPEEFLFCSIPGKKALEKATVSFQEEEYTFKKTSLCSRGSGLRGKHICQPHFSLFGGPLSFIQSFRTLLGSSSRSTRHNIAFILSKSTGALWRNRFLVRRGRVPRKSIVYR